MLSYLTEDNITCYISSNFNKNSIDNNYYNNNDDNNDNNDNNDNHYEYCKNDNKITYFNQYSLNIHCFNPTKNSPPNEWQFRLIKRINSFNTLDNN